MFWFALFVYTAVKSSLIKVQLYSQSSVARKKHADDSFPQKKSPFKLSSM